MDGHRFKQLTQMMDHGASRRRMAAGLMGAALATLAVKRVGGESLARGESMTVSDEHDLEQAIQRMRSATAEFMQGKPEAWKAMCSQRADATLFGGWGGHERGWEQLGPRYDWAAARYAGGEVTFEEFARFATADLAHTVHLERSQARLVGVDESVPVALRVTHVYRREEGGWKLLHRHADPLVAIQTTESVVEQ